MGATVTSTGGRDRRRRAAKQTAVFLLVYLALPGNLLRFPRVERREQASSQGFCHSSHWSSVPCTRDLTKVTPNLPL